MLYRCALKVRDLALDDCIKIAETVEAELTSAQGAEGEGSQADAQHPRSELS